MAAESSTKSYTPSQAAEPYIGSLVSVPAQELALLNGNPLGFPGFNMG